MNLEGFDADRFADRVADGPDRAEFDLPERWILSRVQRATEEVDKALEEHRISDAAQAVYHFIWDEVCDWYIELAKSALMRAEGNAEITANPEARLKIQGALVTALETAMRLLHPFMPFITEEIWQQLPKPSGAPQSIMITLYPVRDVRFYDDASEASMALVQKIIVALRGIRADKGIPSATRVVALLSVNDDYKKTILDGYKTIIAEQGKCREVRVRRAGSSLGGEFSLDSVATALAGDVEVMVPLDGVVDAKGREEQAGQGTREAGVGSRLFDEEARQPAIRGESAGRRAREVAREARGSGAGAGQDRRSHSASRRLSARASRRRARPADSSGSFRSCAVVGLARLAPIECTNNPSLGPTM